VRQVIPPQVEGFILFFELHKGPVSPFFQTVSVPLDGSKPFWSVSHCSLLCIISKYVECALGPIVLVINEVIKQLLALVLTLGVHH